MGKSDNDKCVFPLTSLQIGDLQSYLSDLKLFLAFDSKKLYILVDNRPWLRDLDPRPAHFWQLMVTKSRLSPFANTKAQRGRKGGTEACPSYSGKEKKFEKWFSLVDAANLSRKRASLPVKKLKNSLIFNGELQRTLYGFIVFEVEWTDVRGINYLNELQTDTSLAIEAKKMERWEFDSIEQARSCITSWFSGTLSEQLKLEDFLESTVGDIFYDAEENFSTTPSDDDDDGGSIGQDNLWVKDDSSCCLGGSSSLYSGIEDTLTIEPHTPPPTGPYKRRRVTKSTGTGLEVNFYSEETYRGNGGSLENSETTARDSENNIEAKQYRDVLILFRFNDHDLPFKLRLIIMSDLRLLTLLEAGLPSWVIFLQSYPGFCHLYRPWMCPLARALYVLISIITVLIGFYDLYKNVPVLKATASRLCGPLFDWIENWEMVSRIKYLGTMLFLHNFEKAVTWFLAVQRAVRSFFSIITQPLLAPLTEILGYLLPIWNMFIEVAGSLSKIVFLVIESSCNTVGDLIEIILYPIWFFASVIWNITTSVIYPILWLLWEVIYAPFRVVLYLASFVTFLCASILELFGDIWRSVSGILRLASASEVTVATYEVSIFRSLWNDLFSQVFRALRSILNGFVAFFIACNRHRLSIYNHLHDFIERVFARVQRSKISDSRNRKVIRGTQSQVNLVKINVRHQSLIHVLFTSKAEQVDMLYHDAPDVICFIGLSSICS
ncbi:hypothetical protein K2173_018481 [Erythroxylum novogranatense]|uniref:Uncharacterized protein n=1 Tax=Erythroxylum novogranatense TaxID=1862640 RepID=A0AAV8UDW9_9ROSI|nr:hypothetical protein K2173_018481 [Erythroxylum novogranatense]